MVTARIFEPYFILDGGTTSAPILVMNPGTVIGTTITISYTFETEWVREETPAEARARLVRLNREKSQLHLQRPALQHRRDVKPVNQIPLRVHARARRDTTAGCRMTRGSKYDRIDQIKTSGARARSQTTPHSPLRPVRH